MLEYNAIAPCHLIFLETVDKTRPKSKSVSVNNVYKFTGLKEHVGGNVYNQ